MGKDGKLGGNPQKFPIFIRLRALDNFPKVTIKCMKTMYLLVVHIGGKNMGLILIFLLCAAVLEIAFKWFLSKKGLQRTLTAFLGIVLYLAVCCFGGLIAEWLDIRESEFLEFDFSDGISLGFRMVLPISFVLTVIFVLLDKKFKFTEKK
jgi:hypothetical protein